MSKTRNIEQFQEEQQAWIEAGPLRKWRHKAGLSLMNTAAALGVGSSAMQYWESGSHYPNEASMAKIAEAMEISATALARQWARWYERRPKLAA